jgi:hypothetical protein
MSKTKMSKSKNVESIDPKNEGEDERESVGGGEDGGEDDDDGEGVDEDED